MATAKKKRKKPLAHGRPVTAKQPATAPSSRLTKSLINRHHQLQKRLAKAKRDQNVSEIADLTRQLKDQGGLEQYQQASITGQSAARGGDSSRVLVDWLGPGLESFRQDNKSLGNHLRVLEVGALSVDNAISRCVGVTVDRIDLHSQHREIKQMDFMAMPIPSDPDEKYDLVSLSLVINYVPEAEGRGEMLARVSSFFRMGSPNVPTPQAGGPEIPLPALFLVLPAACVSNSRYLTEARLKSIMIELGYSLSERKLTSKLVYYLWRYNGNVAAGKLIILKEEVNSGVKRYNFSIVLR